MPKASGATSIEQIVPPGPSVETSDVHTSHSVLNNKHDNSLAGLGLSGNERPGGSSVMEVEETEDSRERRSKFWPIIAAAALVGAVAFNTNNIKNGFLDAKEELHNYNPPVAASQPKVSGSQQENQAKPTAGTSTASKSGPGVYKLNEYRVFLRTGPGSVKFSDAQYESVIEGVESRLRQANSHVASVSFKGYESDDNGSEQSLGRVDDLNTTQSLRGRRGAAVAATVLARAKQAGIAIPKSTVQTGKEMVLSKEGIAHLVNATKQAGYASFQQAIVAHNQGKRLRGGLEGRYDHAFDDNRGVQVIFTIQKDLPNSPTATKSSNAKVSESSPSKAPATSNSVNNPSPEKYTADSTPAGHDYNRDYDSKGLLIGAGLLAVSGLALVLARRRRRT